MSFGQTVIQSENFDGCTLSTNWTSNIISGGNPWLFGVNGGDNIDGTCMAYFDDDALGFGAPASYVELLSPVYDMSAYTTIMLELDYNMKSTGGETFTVEVYDGAVWNQIIYETANNCGNWGCAYPHASINVSAYLNAAFQIRFIYDDGGTWVGWYVGIDNLELVEPPARDGGVTAINNSSSCGLSATEIIEIDIFNFGSAPLSNFDVTYWLDSTTTVTETITGPLAISASMTYQFTATADLSASGNHYIQAWTNITTDADNTNDTAWVTIFNYFAVTTFPMTEDFEGTVSLSQSANDILDWTIKAGATVSGSTGPSFDHTTGAGFYAYLETSSPATLGDSAIFESNCIDISSLSVPSLSFWYHMYGATIGTLRLEIYDGTVWTSVWSLSGEQGNQWVEVSVNLSAYVSVGVIYYRFIGVAGSSYTGDLAIDDIQVKIAPAFDANSIALNIASGSCAYSTTDTVKLSIVNYGSTSISAFNVAYRVNGGVPVSENVPATIAAGDTLVYVFAATYDFSAIATYTIDAWSELPSDVNVANDSVTTQITQYAVINTFPYVEDFEGVVSLNQLTTDVMDWTILSGPTASVSTGPAGDHTTGTGNYAYIEASGPAPGFDAIYESNCIDISGLNVPLLSYWYHMYGAAMGSLSVDIYNGTSWANAWQISGDQTDVWLQNTIDLSTYGSVIKIRFTATRGADYTSDVCIDDINLYPETPYEDLSAITMVLPVSGYGLGSTYPLSIDVTNFGNMMVDTFNIGYRINGGGAITEAIYDTINPGQTKTYSYTQTMDFSTVGIYNVDAWTSLTADNINNNDTVSSTTEHQAITLDISANNIVLPATFCGLGSGYTFYIDITNVGNFLVDTFTISYQVNGGTVVTESIYDTLNILQTTTYSFTQTVDLSTIGIYNVTGWSSLVGDVSAANDTTFNSTENIIPINTFPYIEDFEGVVGLTQSANDNLDWTLNVGTTPSSSTGPSSDHTTGAGNYAYLETSSVFVGDSAIYISNCIDISGLTNPAIRFWYHMYGTTMGTLRLEIFDGTTWNVEWTLAGNQGNVWIKNITNLSAYIGVGAISYRFVGVAGTSYTSDMALDDINIINDIPHDDIGVTASNLPIGFCPNTNLFNLTTDISNLSNQDIAGYSVSYSVNGGAVVTDLVAIALLIDSTYTHTFSTGIDISTAGTITIEMWTILGTDTVFSNDTLIAVTTVQNSIISYPYFENFESGAGGWTTSGVLTSWEFGIPANTIIDAAFSGTNAWVTNLTGFYNNSEQSYLESPCLDFSSLAVDPDLEFAIWYETENDWDEVWVETSIDNGITWTKLGAMGTGTNWYNDVNNYWDSNAGGWINAVHVLSGTAGQGSVSIRYVFSSNGSGMREGIGIDDIAITSPIDAAVISVDVTKLDCEYSATELVTVIITNYGSEGIANYNVNYNIDGLNLQLGTVTDSIFPGDTVSYTFSNLADLSAAGVHTIAGWASVSGDGNSTNDSAFVQITQGTTISTFPYLEDFEIGTQLIQLTTDSMNWSSKVGPTFTLFTGPTADHTTGTGTYMYIETSDNNPGDIAIYESACIDISTLSLPFFEFWYHMYGNDISTMYAQIFYNDVWTTVWTLSGNQGDQWSLASVSLMAYSSGGTIKYRIVGSQGSNSAGDMAIDDVIVYDKPPFTDAAVTGVVAPDITIPCVDATSTQVVTVQISNLGVDIGTISMFYTLDGGAAIPGTISSMTLGEVVNFSFPITADISTPGNHDFVVWLESTQDTIASNDTLQFSVKSTSLMILELGNDTSICSGASITLDADAGFIYAWSTGATTQTLTVTAMGNYSCTVTYIDACKASDDIFIAVISALAIDLGANVTVCDGDTLVLDAGVPGANSYAWSNGGTSQTTGVTISGTYYVDVDKCGNASDTIDVTFENCGVGMGTNPVVGLDMKLYPNPNNGLFNIDVSGGTAGYGTIIITSISGQIVSRATYQLVDGKATKSINLTEFDAGIYFVIYENEGQMVSRKLVIN